MPNDGPETTWRTLPDPPVLSSKTSCACPKAAGPLNSLFCQLRQYPVSRQNWRLTGYCLNWQNSELSGPAAFGQAQLVLLDNTGGSGNVLQVVSGPSFGINAAFPLDQWPSFEVDATNAPAGTAKVRTY